MYYKIEAIKIKIPLTKIYARLKSGETLTDIYKDIVSSSKAYVDELDPSIIISQEMIEQENSLVFEF